MRLELFCSCGAIAKGDIEPADGAMRWRDAWLSAHSNADCFPCTEQEALSALPLSERAAYALEQGQP